MIVCTPFTFGFGLCAYATFQLQCFLRGFFADPSLIQLPYVNLVQTWSLVVILSSPI